MEYFICAISCFGLGWIFGRQSLSNVIRKYLVEYGDKGMEVFELKQGIRRLLEKKRQQII